MCACQIGKISLARQGLRSLSIFQAVIPYIIRLLISSCPRFHPFEFHPSRFHPLEFHPPDIIRSNFIPLQILSPRISSAPRWYPVELYPHEFLYIPYKRLSVYVLHPLMLYLLVTAQLVIIPPNDYKFIISCDRTLQFFLHDELLMFIFLGPLQLIIPHVPCRGSNYLSFIIFIILVIKLLFSYYDFRMTTLHLLYSIQIPPPDPPTTMYN